MSVKKLKLGIAVFSLIVFLTILGLLFTHYLDSETQLLAASLTSAFIIASGLLFAFREVRAIEKNQRTSTLNCLDTTWMCDSMSKARLQFHTLMDKWEKEHGKKADWIKEYLIEIFENEREKFEALSQMLNFFEGLAYYVKSGYLDSKDVFGIYAPAIRQISEAFTGFLHYRQEKEKDRFLFDNFIWLSEKVNEYYD